jgi:hypothetical protein
MHEKLRPWIAAIFCAGLAVIVIITSLLNAFINGTSTNGIDFVFYCFLPMCFFFIGDFLSSLRKENMALRTLVNQLSSQLTAKNIST